MRQPNTCHRLSVKGLCVVEYELSKTRNHTSTHRVLVSQSLAYNAKEGSLSRDKRPPNLTHIDSQCGWGRAGTECARNGSRLGPGTHDKKQQKARRRARPSPWGGAGGEGARSGNRRLLCLFAPVSTVASTICADQRRV